MGTVDKRKRAVAVPITLINTRDCFAYDLMFTETELNLGEGREKVIKKEYFFDPADRDCLPDNFRQVLGLTHDADMTDIENLKIGVTCYENLFSSKELDEMEREVEKTEAKSLQDNYLPMTA